jgi:hypothetical protein
MRLVKVLLLMTLLAGCQDTGRDFAMSHEPLRGGLVANLGPVSSLRTPDPLGRWTVEGVTTFSFADDLPASFTLVLDVRHANLPYHKKRFLITAGGAGDYLPWLQERPPVQFPVRGRPAGYALPRDQGPGF